MERSRLSSEEVGQRGEALYEPNIRTEVETEENVGKMVIIDIETGDYEIGDESGIEAARRLHAKRPDAALYGKRIGYNVAVSLGGVMERTAPCRTDALEQLAQLQEQNLPVDPAAWERAIRQDRVLPDRIA